LTSFPILAPGMGGSSSIVCLKNSSDKDFDSPFFCADSKATALVVEADRVGTDTDEADATIAAVVDDADSFGDADSVGDTTSFDDAVSFDDPVSFDDAVTFDDTAAIIDGFSEAALADPGD
jgi:hypothetical protein